MGGSSIESCPSVEKNRLVGKLVIMETADVRGKNEKKEIKIIS